jgi:hypothetical protein
MPKSPAQLDADIAEALAHKKAKREPVPFPFERKPQVPSRWHDDYRKGRVPLSSLIATQSYVTSKGVRSYKKQVPSVTAKRGGWHDIDLPLIYMTDDGRAYIADGHHRLVAAFKRGDRDALVRIIDIGDPDRPTRKEP